MRSRSERINGACPRLREAPDSNREKYESSKEKKIKMTKTLATLGLLVSLQAGSMFGQSLQYGPFSELTMTPETEIALARSAAPEHVSTHATVKVLTTSGFKIAVEGDNGFVCIVMRGWGAPTFTPLPLRDLVYFAKLRAPICFNPAASRTVLPLQELRTKLGMEGKTPDQIAQGVAEAYAKGELPKMETVAFAYMFSSDMVLGPANRHWHPHVMVYTPYYENSMLGGNPMRGALPVVTDDAGTPFAVTVIPVDPELAVKASVR
jgi:hypothetical protein